MNNILFTFTFLWRDTAIINGEVKLEDRVWGDSIYDFSTHCDIKKHNISVYSECSNLTGINYKHSKYKNGFLMNNRYRNNLRCSVVAKSTKNTLKHMLIIDLSERLGSDEICDIKISDGNFFKDKVSFQEIIL